MICGNVHTGRPHGVATAEGRDQQGRDQQGSEESQETIRIDKS